jgi:hypothetical protein
MNMVLVEFIEAIGRVADKLSIANLLDVSTKQSLTHSFRMKTKTAPQP